MGTLRLLSTQAIDHLLHQYGLLAVFLATAGQALCLPIPGSSVVIAAAVYAASRHGLPIVGVLAVATAGVTLGGLGGFALGRWRGEWVLARVGQLARQPPERIERLRSGLERHALIALVMARWFTGTRNLAGIASGASAMSLARFCTCTLVAALLWATITSFEFYLFGGLVLGTPTWLQVVVVLAGLLGTGVALRRLGGRGARTRHIGGERRTTPRR